jgi:hypothetical protein
MKKSTPDFLTKYTLSYEDLRYELNRLSPETVKWSIYFPEKLGLEFEHKEKGTAFVGIHCFEDGTIALLSHEQKSPLLEQIDRVVDIGRIIDKVPQYPPYFKENYEAIAKYLIEQVFDDWLK